MKFNVNAKVFADTLVKVSSIIEKKSIAEAFKHLVINVKNNHVEIYAVNYNIGKLTVKLDAYNIWGEGRIVFSHEEIKSLKRLKGCLTISTSDNEDTFTIISDVGKRLVLKNNAELYDEDCFALFGSSGKRVLAFERSDDVLIDMFNKLSVFLSKDKSVDKVMNYIYFNAKKNRFESTDSFRLIVKDISDWNINADSDGFLIGGDTTSILAKLQNKRKVKDIKVFESKKYIEFECEDYLFQTCKSEIAYPNLDYVINGSEAVCSAMVDSGKLNDILQFNIEITKSESKPIIFYVKDNELYTEVKANTKVSTDYNFSFNLENIPDDFRTGYNPSYLFDLINISDCDEIKLSFTKPTTRLGTRNLIIENNGCKMILLPIKENK